MGTSIIPMQSYAGGSDLQHNNVTDLKNSVKRDAKSKKRQINTKVRITPDIEEITKQTNEGQQIVGKDNEASGFSDQSRLFHNL